MLEPESEQAIEAVLAPGSPVEPEPATALVEAIEAEEETAGQDEPSANGQPKKKRTRRGSRGGRGRKKAVTGADVVEGAADGDGRAGPRIHVPSPELGEGAEPAKATPRKRAAKAGAPKQGGLEAPEEEGAVVADAEVTEPGTEGEAEAPKSDGQPKRKRSRRGSRGGRRRKPAGAGEGQVEVEGQVDGAVQVEAGGEVERTNGPSESPEYVPMSEWIDDFDSRSRS